ncbi:MAG: 3-oxoacyl-ACP synthase [Candidatus Marinimicrobia bacterium]|nr:3-oxoacyl-ACP synthase [Candidatus Neomarinimicrobiota bacterium]
MNANITAVGKFLPEKVIKNSEFEKYLDTSDEWIISRTGIKERRQLELGKASSYMAIKAIEQLLERRKIKASDIDSIIVSTITPDMIFPSTACLIQDHFKISNCWGFDLSAACSGFLFGLETADALIKSKKYKKIIVVGVDKMSSILDYQDRNTCVLFGDGAGAVLFEPSSDYGVIDCKLGVDGSGAKFLNMPAGGSLNPTTDETVSKRMHYVKQNGATVFKSAVKGMYDITQKIMSNNNISNENLDLFIAHQANKRIIDATAKKMGLNKNQVLINIDKYANTTAASIPLALCDAYENKMLNIGNNLILTAFGAGFTWGSCLIKWGIDCE